MRVVTQDKEAWVASDVDDETTLRELVFGPALTWVRAGGSSPEEFERLGRILDLHPLALEDVQSEAQRPKVEDYGEVTFAVVRVPRTGEGSVSWSQTGIFLGKGFVVTASTAPTAALEGLESRLTSGAIRRPVEQADDLFYHVVDALVDSFFPFLHSLEDSLEDLEDVILDRAGPEELASIRALKQTLSQTRKVTAPMREAMLSLERSPHPNIRESTRTYLRDVADHMIRIAENIEHVKEMALIAQETWNSTLANRQNELMKRLTVVAGVLLVPSLLAGIAGMNFTQGMPTWNFAAVTLGIFGVTLVGLMWSRLKGWL